MRITKNNSIGAVALGILIMALGGAGCGGRGGGGIAAETTVSTGSVAGNVFARIVSAGRSAEAIAPGMMPLPDATITCGGVSASSNAAGRYVARGVPAGQQTCIVRKQGYEEISFSVFVTPNAETECADVIPEPSQAGALTVSSTPEGAALLIDGAIAAATAPATLDTLAAGTHTVSVSLEGYENGATQSVDIAAGATAAVSFTLHKLVVSITVTPASATLDIGATQQLAAECVFFDGTSAGCTNEVEWRADGGAVSVSSTGLATAISQGLSAVVATRTESGVSSAAADIAVGSTMAERNCSAASGLCIDIVGADANGAGAAIAGISLLNPPAAGLGAGEFTISWDPAKMNLSSATPSAGVTPVASSISNTEGTYKVIYVTSAAITAGQELFSLMYTVTPGTAGQIQLNWGTAIDATNMTDFAAVLLDPVSYMLVDGYINPAP